MVAVELTKSLPAPGLARHRSVKPLAGRVILCTFIQRHFLKFKNVWSCLSSSNTFFENVPSRGLEKNFSSRFDALNIISPVLALVEPLHPLNGPNFMPHPGYVASLSSCILCTTCVGGGGHSQGGLCSARAAGCTGWQPSSRRGKCASIASAQIFRRRHTTPKNTMSASKEGSRVGTLRVGVTCRLIPGADHLFKQ